jgi:hypothetical protein
MLNRCRDIFSACLAGVLQVRVAATTLTEIELADATGLVKQGAVSRYTLDQKQAQFDQSTERLPGKNQLPLDNRMHGIHCAIGLRQ